MQIVKLLKNIVLTLLLLNCLLQVNAQTFLNKNYNVDNGLPSSETYRVLQDSKGYIWIATNQGVSRFDGYKFENFDMQDGLSENTILDLFEDKLGRIWFISVNGNLSWYLNGKISRYKYNSVIAEYASSFSGVPQKNNFYVDTCGTVYIGFLARPILCILPDGTTNFGSFSNTQGLNIYSGNDYYLHSINYGVSEDVTIISKEGKGSYIKGLLCHGVRSNLLKINEQYLYSGYKNLSAISPLDSSIKNYHFNAEIIWLSKDFQYNIWVGHLWEGVKAYSDINFTKAKYELLKGYSVSSVLNDSEGGYWFSTLENGIYYFPSLSVKSLNQSTGLKAKAIRQVEQFDNEIWFGGNSSELYRLNDDRLYVNSLLKDDQNMCYLLREINGSLFVSSFGKSVNINALLNREKILKKSIGQLVARDAIAINNKILLFYKQHFITDFELSSFSVINPFELNNTTFSAIKYNFNTLWLGTSLGLYQFSIESNEVSPITYSPLFRNRINTLLFDSVNNTVWLGTKGAGLLQVKDSLVTQFTANEGIISNSISSILKVDSLLWLGTNNGVEKISLQNDGSPILHNGKLKAETFSRANGLINNEVNDIELHNGNIYAATSNGLSYFSHSLGGDNKVPPPIYITDIKVMGLDTLFTNETLLKHNQNYIEIGFVGLSYQRYSPLEYEYKLEGIDKNWNSTTNLNVQYPKLLPGKYTFSVRAINRSGMVSLTPATVSFTIQKAYYQTFWFKLLLYGTSVLLIILSIFVWYLNKVKNLKKRNLLLEEVNKYRQRALSAQMNPHFIYNSLNSVQSYILNNNPDKSSAYLSMFGNLMRRVLENSQHPLVSLSEEIEALKLYVNLESMRFHGSFDFHLIIQNDIDTKAVKIPPLVIQPYVENAIHHGLRLKQEKGNLWLSVKRNESELVIVVEDNGVGRKHALSIKNQTNSTTKSYGTEITSKRLALLNELYNNEVSVRITDKIENNQAIGTRVELHFKFAK